MTSRKLRIFKRHRPPFVRYSLISIGVLGLVLSMLWSSFSAYVAERDTLGKLHSRMIESSVTRTIESVENSIYILLQDLAEETGTPDISVYSKRIENIIRFAPHIRQIVLMQNERTIYDSHFRFGKTIDMGKIVFPYRSLTKLSLGIQVGNEVIGRYLPVLGERPPEGTKRKLIPLLMESKPNVEGQHYDIIVGLNAHYMEALFKSTDLAAEDSYSLLRVDGEHLVHKDGGEDNTFYRNLLDRMLDEGADERTIRTSRGVMPDQQVTLRLSAKYPLAVAISLDHRASLANWFAENRNLIFALCLTTVAVLFIAFWLYSDLQRSKLLRKEVLLLSSAVQQSPVCFLITDRNGHIEYANPAFEEVYGFSQEQYMGKRPSIIKSGKTEGHVYQELWKSITQGKSWQGEFLNRTRDGRLIPTSTAISPVIDEDGHYEYIVGALLDISEQKKLQEQALEASHKAHLASEAKSNFLATMSHELRTPMTGIQGVIELLKQNRSEQNEQGELLDDLTTSANALMMLLNDILDLSKIEAGKLQTEVIACSPSAILRNVVHLFRETALEKNVILESNAQDHKDVWVKTDSLRLRQVLSNLISNAVKFTAEGRIDVRLDMLDLAPGKVIMRITVSDTGIGMDADQLKAVFEPFTQADASTTRKYGGTGLGLTISKQLCGLLGGRLKVDSKLGVGSTFSVELPVDLVRAPAQVESRPAEIGVLDILLAEDNVVNQKVVATILRQKGHRIDIAENGEIAVEKANARKYDIILMDMQMPVMDGVEATSLIRKDSRKNAETIIFAFTADAFPEHHGKYLDAGINDVVTKPLDWKQLETRLYQHLFLKKTHQ